MIGIIIMIKWNGLGETDMQLRALEVFVTVVEKNGFTRAAEALYVGQPALSKTIQKLEQDLNVTLFDRTSKKIQLTDEGKLLYEKSKEILAKINSIPESLNELSQVISGEVKVGIPQIIGSIFFPQIAYHFMKRYPNVTLTTKEDGGVIIEKLVTQGELDIGFVVLPAANTIEAELIYQDKFVVCVSSKHPLAKVQAVRLSELKDEKFILFDKSFALYNLIRNRIRLFSRGFLSKHPVGFGFRACFCTIGNIHHSKKIDQ
ncbi:LysR family transcriptional regulator [Siminovitchia terrae]|uniref:LysR family transcriptional regulator n=2 Tax=Siminovitchia terrae TaxID=1914933 RepID=A0A429X7C0_SIMTE|nr:LysR family transcriptional regulator [Siminovitchia terrae]